MGMSGDFEQAIKMGSGNVRVGSTIFGVRFNCVQSKGADAVKAAVDKAVAELGPVSIVVANANTGGASTTLLARTVASPRAC